MKKVLLAVSGGIAVYKACDIVSKLTKRNVDVQVIMTENATKFRPVFSDGVLLKVLRFLLCLQ